MQRCFVALGGNRGDVAETFRQALEQLDTSPGVHLRRSSSIYRTGAVGDSAGSPFLNAAAELETDVAPRELLHRLHTIEASLGRTRDVHWGPRTLDLDLIFHGAVVLDDPGLKLPHPACWYRRFVLDPLEEIAPEFVHPQKQVTVAELRTRLLTRPLRVELAGGTAETRERIMQDLQPHFPAAPLSHWTGHDEAVLIPWLGPDDAAHPWDDLPPLPRLDLSRADHPRDALRFVLQAALDEPQRCGTARTTLPRSLPR